MARGMYRIAGNNLMNVKRISPAGICLGVLFTLVFSFPIWIAWDVTFNLKGAKQAD